VNSVPKFWPNSTIVCIGSGPSLTPADVGAVHGRARVIAVNDAYRLAPWADVLYAADAQWWTWHAGVPTFHGPKYSVSSSIPVTWPDVQILQNTGPLGLECAPTGLRTGYNSGYQAINLAVHFGAARILLLGYDMQPAANGQTHFFGDHPDHSLSPYGVMRLAFESIVQPLKEACVEAINCTPGSALTCFPCRRLDEALSSQQVAA